MARIYFDESGQTGAHLLDRNQPYFTLESTDFSEAGSAEGRGIQPNKHCIVFGDWYLGRVRPRSLPDKSRVINDHTVKLSMRRRAQWAELVVAGEGDDEQQLNRVTLDAVKCPSDVEQFSDGGG